MTPTDRPGEDTPDPAVAGTTAVAPAGSHAIVVHSDLRCPWAHVAVHRLLAAAERLGVEQELCLDHRWFPLDEALPTDAAAFDQHLAPVLALDPDAGWRSWADDGAPPTGPARLAAAWVQAAKAQSPAASMALDRALRQAFFAGHRDLDDPGAVADVAATVGEVDADAAAAEVASGRPEAELDRHAEVSRSELVPVSPTFVLADGSRWTNPGIEFHVEDGVPVVDEDDPTVHDEIIERFLALRHYD
ncbi:MAG TPA: hypothetical protein VFU14_18160 [Acidimicrobiales bacterium]|nr:hypothetical protein [Acidimicrobiales bacterium]